MDKYIGCKFEFNNKEWQKELQDEGVNIEDGTIGTIESLECEADDDFEDCYWNIKINGTNYCGMSGYHLILL